MAANNKWNWIGTKADKDGVVWRMWEWKRGEGDRIVKRTAPSSSTSSGNWTVTLYWRRGDFNADGTPRWVRYLSDLTHGTTNGE